MKHIKTITVVLVLALATAFCGCVDSKSRDSAEEAGGAADAAHYLDLIDVNSLHYKATASGNGEDAHQLFQPTKSQTKFISINCCIPSSSRQK